MRMAGVFATYWAAAGLGFLIAAALPLPAGPNANFNQAISQSETISQSVR